jgi:hypothetical protein
MQAEGKELENIGYDKTLLDSFSLVFAIVVGCMARHSSVEVIIKVGPSDYQIKNDNGKEKPAPSVRYPAYLTMIRWPQPA